MYEMWQVVCYQHYQAEEYLSSVSKGNKMKKLILKYPRTFTIIVGLFFAFLLIKVCGGCGPHHSLKGTCIQDATYCTSVYGFLGYPTRIVRIKNSTHYEAQAKVNGEWKNLHTSPREVTTKKHTPDFDKIYDPRVIFSWCYFE